MKSFASPKGMMSLSVRTASGKSNSWRAKEALIGCLPPWLDLRRSLSPKEPAHASGFAPMYIVASCSTTIRALAPDGGVRYPSATTTAKYTPSPPLTTPPVVPNHADVISSKFSPRPPCPRGSHENGDRAPAIVLLLPAKNPDEHVRGHSVRAHVQR